MPVVCDIVGYVGNHERCVEVLMEGLRRIEYHGYDPTGRALRIPRPHRVDVPALELMVCWAERDFGGCLDLAAPRS